MGKPDIIETERLRVKELRISLPISSITIHTALNSKTGNSRQEMTAHVTA
jgi:hypothetical protein